MEIANWRWLFRAPLVPLCVLWFAAWFVLPFDKIDDLVLSQTKGKGHDKGKGKGKITPTPRQVVDLDEPMDWAGSVVFACFMCCA